jgi:hypothetical protein
MAVAIYVIYVAVVYLAMPANPDPVEMPPELLWPCRAIAFLGLTLFRAALGGAFVWLLRDASTPSPVGRGSGVRVVQTALNSPCPDSVQRGDGKI